MPTSLVTGGAGFLGTNLTEALLEKGHRVIVLDNFSIGSKENLTHLDGKDLEIVEADVREPLNIQESVDFVWNLACIASPVHYIKHPIETIETNVLGIPNVLKFAIEKNAQILHTSTSEVYGDPLEHPQKETYWGNVNTLGEHAPYKESKRVGETIVNSYAHVYPKLDVRMVRIFNTYGPFMALHDGRMVSEFMLAALTGKPLRVEGGQQTRSTCYVSDMIAGLVAVMDNNEKTRNEVINLGNPDEHTVQEFAQIVIDIAGSKSEIQTIPARNDDVSRRKPDIIKAKTLLGWQPKIKLEEGLKKTMEWMKKKLKGHTNH